MSDDDDTDDEGLAKKLIRRVSPGPGPNSPASHREPRTCVLKVTVELSQCYAHFIEAQKD